MTDDIKIESTESTESLTTPTEVEDQLTTNHNENKQQEVATAQSSGETNDTNSLLAERIRKIEEREQERRLASRISAMPESERDFATDLLKGLNLEQKEVVLRNYEEKIAQRSSLEKPIQNDFLGGKSKEEALDEAYNAMKHGGAAGRDAAVRFYKIVNGGK